MRFAQVNDLSLFNLAHVRALQAAGRVSGADNCADPLALGSARTLLGTGQLGMGLPGTSKLGWFDSNQPWQSDA